MDSGLSFAESQRSEVRQRLIAHAANGANYCKSADGGSSVQLRGNRRVWWRRCRSGRLHRPERLPQHEFLQLPRSAGSQRYVLELYLSSSEGIPAGKSASILRSPSSRFSFLCF
ncbi:hypothetical protein EYF80_048276 [Liparis tanakae]|uniref:Uncharacterized protein n=1 Tax=Liparis tanakae TaxID=230148 RepID=A0A4Z2FMN5_9TELE|nr:hypothetical protein EYF80_048276 [Liparis tanakae]